MFANSVDPDQIALEQYDRGLHHLPVILLSVHNSLIQKHKVNVQGNLKKKKNTVHVSFGRKNYMLFFF